MVKLASARESRMYGPRLYRNRLEYINAGLYLFATILLLSGFAALFTYKPESGLILLLIALALIAFVNLHDLFAHVAGIDYRFELMQFDLQLAVVEFTVPVVQTLGTVLSFLGFLFLFLPGAIFIWLGIFGSLLFFIGGINNVTKVFKMQQANGLRLEKLRGGAQERLIRIQEGRVPLIIEESWRWKGPAEEGRSAVVPTPYKDVLVRQA